MLKELNLNIIEELVKYVNAELLKGKSIAVVEKENGLGKDTLRKRLNRNFYYYSKSEKQFVFNEDKAKSKGNITHNNTTCYKKDKTAYNTIKQKDIMGGAEDMSNQKLTEFKALSDKEKVEKINNISKGNLSQKELEKELGFTNISSYIDRNYAYWDGKEKIYKLIKSDNNNIFNDDEIMILKEIISNYQKQKNIKTQDFEGEVVTRSFRSYKNIMEQFADFCSKNNIQQKDAIATALTDFINKNS